MEFLVVALGGAVGAMARYAISLIPVKSGFPFLTLATNIMGALLIGFVVGIASGKNEVSENTILFWKTGVISLFAMRIILFGLLIIARKNVKKS